MQVFLRRVVENSYSIPLFILAVCIWRVFVPQLPANDGLGWDGYRYYQLTVDGLQSGALDSYLVLRIFPSLLIHTLFKLFGIAFTPASVILGFKIMNCVLIAGGAWMVKKIFEQFNLSAVAQLTGFILVFLNYGVLNFTFYYPVMTDTPAFFLSVALFYFFIKGELLNVFLTGLIGAFTFPVLLPMAIALMLFPKLKGNFTPIGKSVVVFLGSFCVGYAIYMAWLLLVKNGEKADLPFTLPISQGMLPVSFLAIGGLYFFMPYVLRNRIFFTKQYYLAHLNGNRILAVIFLFIAFLIVRTAITVNVSSEYFTLYHQLKIHLLYAFQRPFITVVSHFNYFGCVMLLTIIFWRKFFAYISTFGLGVAGVTFLSLFVFFMKPESRALIFFFPWLMILLALFLGQYKFSKLFYILSISINFAAAKLWLYFDYKDGPLLPDGTIDFPNQWFMMHLGIWMTEQVWLFLCLALVLSLLLFILSLYKIEFGKKSILFYKKFEPVNYE